MFDDHLRAAHGFSLERTRVTGIGLEGSESNRFRLLIVPAKSAPGSPATLRAAVALDQRMKSAFSSVKSLSMWIAKSLFLSPSTSA